MSTELILIRHGKALSNTMDMEMDDAERPLTSKGVKDLQEALPGLKLLLNLDQKLLIWCSPLLRARQTAEIIAAEFEVKKSEPFDFISSGDFSALADQVGKTDQPFTLMIIGHEPHLSEWSRIIGGLDLPFKKAAAAGFKLLSTTPLAGELSWFMQPRALRKIAGGRKGGKR